ncbi:hypothetical protein [Chelativorans salis]|uniref:DUF3035 domain-containing protein n=1 Tax=Chelativorans salis TaxID=2978478 RepID=A0ABT2LHF6_9HYPH|nr:hypothetical protein [Chelativorans sp. EGI FJ00035]MCT7373868.1 hypothetical protein [Chelativorans sp. EGI FJ00035]
MNSLGSGARIGGGRSRMGPKAIGAALAVSAIVLSACSGTTYGTGTTSEEQLVQDLTGVLSLAPKKKAPIDYSPRPGIVKPPSTEVLPPPQESLASAGNPAWPESPEQRLARVRAEATANQDNPLYRPNIVQDVDNGASTGAGGTGIRFSESGMVKPEILERGARTRNEQRLEVQRRQQMAKQGSPTTRRYLSDPPTELRQPAPTAPTDQLGEDEWKKERAAKKAGAETGGLRRLIPWLN